MFSILTEEDRHIVSIMASEDGMFVRCRRCPFVGETFAYRETPGAARFLAEVDGHLHAVCSHHELLVKAS